MGVGRFQEEQLWEGSQVEVGLAGPSPALDLCFLICAMGRHFYSAKLIEGR